MTQAAKAGDARAVAQLALLAGIDGLHASMARAALATARSAGFEPARRILGGAAVTATLIDYDVLAKAVNLAQFDGPLNRETKSDAPAISVVHDLLPGWACDYVAALAEP